MKKASAKKSTNKKASAKRKSRKPVDMQALRESIANLVGVETLNICNALAEEAKKGELAPARFLFGMSGLYPVSASVGDQDSDADLARI